MLVSASQCRPFASPQLTVFADGETRPAPAELVVLDPGSVWLTHEPVVAVDDECGLRLERSVRQVPFAGESWTCLVVSDALRREVERGASWPKRVRRTVCVAVSDDGRVILPTVEPGFLEKEAICGATSRPAC